MSISEKDVIRFIYDEARMLDEGRYTQWLELFAQDAIYWMPLQFDETDIGHVTSLFYDDLLLLRVRVERLAGKSTFSQQPPSRCHHLLQAPFVDKYDPAAGEYRTWTSFMYTESRLDEKISYAGWTTHDLVEDDGKLRIKLKKIQLIDCEAPHRNIQLFM